MAKTDEYQICTAARNKLEEYVDPNEELKHPTWFKVPEWDVDSFEGLEYNSSEYKNEFSNDEDENQWRRFKRQLIENKGFYVERELWPWYNYSDYKVVPNLDLPASFGQTYRGFDVEFVEVVRGIFSAGSRSKSFITFMAREKPDGPPVEYQAKVWCTVVRNQNYPILCRRALTTKPPSQN
ncbi:Cystatin/monellin superfamily protein [Arabidopsis thaliana]|uniref:Cystatin/monellin superfamily protein n=2 Tax=Arabidopsis thaliana TaxID=3702 RepID=F4J8G8_ARATH|nr:Cystatin/monellin superfamily protein [Arabidopsis thaliana]AEE74279.1 Cystatin/monellin superfamily protein [Arabidopsis thaliana]|eukprot:NP_683532.1 Cystatin/monellin superfamily protein [Arabidopsis thaliana]